MNSQDKSHEVLSSEKQPVLKSTPIMPVAADKLKKAEQDSLIDDIKKLRQKCQAIILAHNYQIPEIQDIADFVGDSLGLAQQAAKTEAKTIVFCGVHFMAETAAVLCPDKRVLIPDLEAGCSLAASINADQLRTWKKEHPGAIVVSYVNTSVEVKAESDYCCTSGNAVKIVQAIPTDKEILFLPDVFLGSWIKKVTGRKNMEIWMGECHVHAAMRPEMVTEKLKQYPQAELLIHPECGCLTPFLDQLADNPALKPIKVTSTEGMVKEASKSKATQFVVATEEGILHRMRKENPDKTFIPIAPEMTCQFMKMITLEKLHKSLRDDVYPVIIEKELADKARRPIERMVSIF